MSLAPQISLQFICGELDYLRQMLDLFDRGESPPVEGLCDPLPLLEKLESQGSFLEGGEFLSLAGYLDFVKELRRFFSHHRELAPLLWRKFQGLTPLPELADLIRSKIDEEGQVRDNASPALKKLFGEKDSSERRIQKDLNRLVRFFVQQKLLQEDFYTLRGDRYVLPVRAAARSRVQGILHDVSGTGETVFIEPLEIVELTNNLAAIRIRIRDEIMRILVELSDITRSHKDVLYTNSGLTVQFDFLHAKARFALVHYFSIPEVVEEGNVKILRGHHPLLYLKDQKTSVPLSLELKDEDKVLMITGPNAGGKTTALKTIGLLSMMVQSGLAVPAHPDSRFPIFHKWFADIGDAQDVTEGVSTFSAHIRAIAGIIRESDGRSLVLLDELGTATDPAEGGSLAVSILEKLAQCADLTIATSHLSPLKAWAHQFPGARNASFRLDEVTRDPTFQIMLDVPGASQAFLIAEREGLSPDIMERARTLLPSGEADLSQLVASLQKKEKEIEANKREITQLLGEQKKLRRQMTELQDYLKEKERRMEEDMLAAKESLLKEARLFIEKQIAHLPTRQAVVEARKEITREIQKVEKQQRKVSEKYIETTNPDQFVPGMTVYVPSLNEYGEIQDVDRVKSLATINLKGMEVTAPLSGLKIPLAADVPPQRSTRIVYQKKDNVPFDLDLHGMRVEEMLSAVEQYLNDAMLADLPYVRLLHGVGTGALRRALHDFLKYHPLVKEYRYGIPEEGGGGVTIVKFK